MAVPVNHKDLLRNYVADTHHSVWARDLVCLAIQTGGQLSDDDKFLVWSECDGGETVPSQTIPTGFSSPFPKVELLKLTHVNGINALAPNQDIVFCDEGVTLLYGMNRSGKSGYFRILNQLASSTITYPLHPNIFSTAPPAAKDIVLEYRVDGTAQPAFHWDGVAACPLELRHIRCFDSQYAANFLKPRTGNTYLFESYNLRIFRAIKDTLQYLKNDMGAAVDTATEASLTDLCSTQYKALVSQALLYSFKEELKKLGMENLNVDLVIDDLLVGTSQIAIRMTNSMAIDAVLSEAELKCAALALFFAECDLMEIKQPIVFDDPVNSLDASIIQYFANRIRDLDSEAIVFTHNVLLMEALTDKRNFDVFNSATDNRTKPKFNKKHLVVYDVLTDLQYVGYVVDRKVMKTKFYLDSAQVKLSVPGPAMNIDSIVADLRMAAEWAIDEVIFLGLPTRRFKGSEGTSWTKMLRMVNAGDANVKEIKRNYNLLSGMTGIHLGYSAYATLPSPSTLQTIHDDLLNVYLSVYP